MKEQTCTVKCQGCCNKVLCFHKESEVGASGQTIKVSNKVINNKITPSQTNKNKYNKFKGAQHRLFIIF